MKKPKPSTRWHRPKAKNTDITVTHAVVGYEASIPPVKGGCTISITHIGGSFEVHSKRTERTISLSMGELEAIALIYAKLQETK